jgi:hypothetical protein
MKKPCPVAVFVHVMPLDVLLQVKLPTTVSEL